MPIRRATPDDHPAFVSLFPELQVDDPIPSFDTFRDDMAPGTWIAEEDGVAVGYLYAQLLNGLLYIRQVVVAPAARGRRVGQALMEAAAAEGRAAGFKRWCLNVKPHNRSAIALYTRMGMAMRYPSTAMRILWSRVGEAIPTLPVEAGDEARIERATGMEQGLLERWRGNPKRVMRCATLDGEVVAAGLFNPDFPGVFPFRVMRPGFAEGFLAGFRPWAKHELVNFVVEDQPAIRAELLEIGAEVRMEIHHYEGDL